DGSLVGEVAAADLKLAAGGHVDVGVVGLAAADLQGQGTSALGEQAVVGEAIGGEDRAIAGDGAVVEHRSGGVDGATLEGDRSGVVDSGAGAAERGAGGQVDV